MKEYKRISASIESANMLCQVHTSHVDRLQEFALSKKGVSLVDSIAARKGTAILFLKVDESTWSHSDHGDYLERFSRTLWDTWFVAPNLNRVTLLNTKGYDSRHRVEGNIRKGVVPAIFRALSEIKNDDNTGSKISLRVAVYPPKLQSELLEGLEDHNENRKDDENDCCKNMDVQFSPGNPTHTISIIKLHPGVSFTPKSKEDNDKALYVLGRLETAPPTRERSLSDDTSGGVDKYRFQQQRTSQVPRLTEQMDGNDNQKKSTSHNDSTTPSGSNTIDSGDDKSISRAYWKLQEAWERYKFDPPFLVANKRAEPMWALDCGAAPGGWTKFLFHPGIVDRIYAIDPGKLSPEVVPGLDEANQSVSPIIRYMDTTIQKALPELASQLAWEHESNKRKNPFLDIWVSDMNIKDMSGQITYFLEARSGGVVGPGTFFVLTLKCMVGYSATAFDHQAKEQVKRLEGISRDVHVVHLFSNRNSERTVIGYLL